jgi:hypothetical protein
VITIATTRYHHRLSNLLTRTHLALQLLEHTTTVSPSQAHLITMALTSLVQLEALLDQVDR